MTIIDTRLAELARVSLGEGNHDSPDEGMCAMEAAAWVAGEDHSDHPVCVCPVIGAFVRSWNDSLLSDEDRDRLLKPLVPKLIGTASTSDVQDRRAFMAADWAVRIFTAAWLRVSGLTDEADELAALPELTTVELCEAAAPAINRARAATSAAWAADATSAATDATSAATDAARAAAWAAARAATGAATSAASAAADAARAATSAAAWAAATAGAGAALADTVTDLQVSAMQLLVRMCDA